MHGETWIDAELANLRAQALERRLREMPPEDAAAPFLNFASNDYLHLRRAPEVVAAAQAAAAEWGAGAGASRLVSGTLSIHSRLENRLAALKSYPSALLFGSGYAANIGIITAVIGRDDWLVVDRLAHASIMDAAVLSRAEFRRYQHNDLQHLEEILRRRPPQRRCLIVTESVFSMDGDCAPLQEIAALAIRYEAMLMVDEAHATGVFGPHGAGLGTEYKLTQQINISMGTLSKALGSFGGFCACSENMRAWLVNRARAFVFSTALPPPAAGAALAALDYLARCPEAGTELLRRAEFFRARLQAAGLDTGKSSSQIVPVMIGDNHRVLEIAAQLSTAGIFVPAIRPPTVPVGTARLRFSITLAHTIDDLAEAADRVVRILRLA